MLIQEKIEKLITPTLTSLGLSCVRILLLDSKRAKTLQIMIERIDGKNIGSDDCQKASQEISVLLDVENVFSEKYFLEISSPGISRPLVKLDDYEKFVGKNVAIKTNIPIIGVARSYKGKIVCVIGNVITIEQSTINGLEKVEIDFNLIEKANLIFMSDDFKQILKNNKEKKGKK